jgi:hypothetical protein
MPPHKRLIVGAALAAASTVLTTCRLDELVAPPPAGVLTISISEVSDSAAVGSTERLEVTVELTNPGERNLSWSASKLQGGSWLILSATSGTVPTTVTVTLNPAGLPVGVYQDTVAFQAGTSTGEPTRIPVRYTIHPCAAPDASFGTEASDSLTTTSCGAPHRVGRFAAAFSFDAAAGDSVSASAVSADFDTYLVISSALDGTTVPLAESDDCLGASGDACIVYALVSDSGTYYVEVTSSAR